MAGQDQAIPKKPQPAFQVAPLVPAVSSSSPGTTSATSSDQPQQSQQQERPAGSATVGAGLSASAGVGADLLTDIFKTNEQTVAAKQVSMRANNAVDDLARTAIDNVYDSSMAAYNNLSRIQRWAPTGAPELFGLFDSDWNAGYQQTSLEANQLKVARIEDRARTMKIINDRAPEFSKLAGELATKNYEAFGKGLDFDLRVTDAKIKAQQENRTEQVAAIDRLSQVETKSQLQQAKAGKGPFAGLEGLLEDHIIRNDKAVTELGQMHLALSEGRSDFADKSLRRVVSYLPPTFLTGAVNDAMKNNQAGIIIPDGKGGKLQVPLPIAQEVLASNLGKEEGLRTQLAGRVAQDAAMPETINQVTASASALATMDSRAGHEANIVKRVLDNTNYEDVNSVRTSLTALAASKLRLKDIATDVSKTFNSDEAKAAIVNYGTTGTFTDVGGRAVVKDTIGNFGMQKSSKYSSAFDAINTAVASKLTAQQAGGMDWNNTSALGQNSNAATMNNATVMAILSQNKAKLSQNAVTESVLMDPAVNQQVITAVQNTVRPNALISTIRSLSQDKNSAPIWHQIDGNWDMVQDNTGALDTRKLIEVLEQQSVASGYKANYVNSFKQRLQKYGAVADQQAAQDPSYTVADRALESAYFGTRPQSTIVGDLYREVDVIGKSMSAEMRARINADLTGQTDQNATRVADSAASFADTGALGMLPTTSMSSQINVVPSATGAKLTTQQIRSMFRNGAP